MYVNARGIALWESAATTGTITSGASYSVRLGTARNDLFSGLTGDTMKGGLGDDTYYLWNATSSVVEFASEGVDTVVAKFWGVVTLPENVENLVLASAGSTAGTGNALANVITAGTIGATLDGLGGDDVLVGGKGADVFRVSAGNGSDAIVGFESGKDTIQLKSYGFTSFAQVMGAATQTGADVTIALGNGERLVLQGVQASGLVAADFGFQAAAAADRAAPGTTAMLTAGKANTFNGWTVFNNVWNPGSLKEGVDYTINSSYNRGDMTGGTSFSWSFPYVTDASPTIRAYPEVMFGVPPKGNYAGNPSDKANTFPIPLDKLHGLTASHDLSIGGTTSGFNVAYDVWLTSKPNGDRSTITHEIMIWVHKGEVQPFGTLVGTYTDGAATAKIYHTGTYTAVVFDTDKLSGTVDIAGIIAKLQGLGIVTGTQYVAAVELGAEVVSGVGNYTINNLDLHVETVAGNGNLIVNDVTGSGAKVMEIPAFALAYTAGIAVEHDAKGSVIGSTVTSLSADGVTIKHLDLQGRTVSTDVLVAYGTNGVMTKHFDATTTLTSVEVFAKNSPTVSALRHYDANNNLLSYDKILTDEQGRTTSFHFDPSGKLLGSEKTIVDGLTTTKQYFDAGSNLLRFDQIVTTADGQRVVHFDPASNVVSVDTLTRNPDGSVLTQHFAGGTTLTGFEIVRTDGAGVVTETFYNAAGQSQNTLWTGTTGADTITTNTGPHETHAGLGSDVLTLGKGGDYVYFDTVIGTDVDRLIGFNPAKDAMYLDRDVFAGLKAGTLSAGAFVEGTAAQGANDRIIYDKATGNVWFDADGSGGKAAVLFAQVDPGTALTHADFIVF
jgi:serralysin